jgi:uncharacterized protein YcsI (UPF0317 family)
MQDTDWRSDSKLLRQKVRSGEWKESTASVCQDYVQANLVILPKEYALDFTLFCLRNPQPCPILEVMEAGDPMVRDLSREADIRTDLPMYCVFRNGKMVEEKDNIRDDWRDDLVTFLIGCSYTFEEALVRGGVPLKNYGKGKDTSVYISSVRCRPAGIFSGRMVVSMRAIPPHLVSRAVQITSRFPKTHGAPIHIGNGAAIGINDLTKIDFGDLPEMDDGDVTVFWGCGVTPQIAALESKVPFMITHKPCHMFVSDLRIEEIATS